MLSDAVAGEIATELQSRDRTKDIATMRSIVEEAIKQACPSGTAKAKSGRYRQARKKVTVVYPASDQKPVPDRMHELASVRTEHLHRIAPRTPLCDLLVSAYLQGCDDMASALKEI